MEGWSGIKRVGMFDMKLKGKTNKILGGGGGESTEEAGLSSAEGGAPNVPTIQ